MNILENLKNIFIKESVKEVVIEKQIEKAELSEAIRPLFQEVAPDENAGKYLENLRSWGFIALSAIADEISTTKLRLLKKSGNNWEEIEDSPVLDLIENPSSFQTREELLWLIMIYLGAEGEAPLALDSSTNPTEMMLLRPDRIKPVFDSDKIVSEYKYSKPNGHVETIPADELIFSKYPSLLNPFRGAGFLKYITKTINLDTFTEAYLNNFFYNSASPSAVLETDKELNGSIIERIRHQFEKRHRGVQKAHKLAILEKGLKYKQTSPNLNDLTIKDIDNRIRDKVLATFKVPKSVIGIIEDVNRASAHTANNSFYRGAIRPRLRMFESQLNKMLLPKFSGTENMKIEFEDPVMEDKELNAKVDDIYLKNGVLTVDEVREKLGLEELEQMQEPKEEPKEDPEEEDDKMIELFKNIIDKRNPTKFEYTKQEIETYHNNKIVFTDRQEQKFKEKLVRYFERINNRVLLSISKKDVLNAGEVSLVYELEAEANDLAKISAPILLETVESQSALTFALIGMESQLTGRDELVKKFIASRSLKFSKSVSKTTKKKLQLILRKWGKEEEPISILKKRLGDYFGNAERTRVDTIVRTEVSRAAGFATLETYKEAGVVGKKWVTSMDERVCAFCAAMNGKIIPINKNFWNKGDEMGAKNPDGVNPKLDFKLEGVNSFPLHPKCRCDLEPIWEESEMPKNPFGYRKISERNLINRKKEITRTEELLFREDELSKKGKELKDKDKEMDSEYKELLKADSRVKEKENEIKKKDNKINKEIKSIKKLCKEKKKLKT